MIVMGKTEEGERVEHIVWMDVQERIVSFHPVDGYLRRSFLSHTYFLRFILDLQQQGYRFQ